MVKKSLKKRLLDSVKNFKIYEERKTDPKNKNRVLESGIYIWKNKTRLSNHRFKNVAEAIEHINKL